MRRNSTVGEQMQMELRRVSLAGQLRRGSRAEVGADVWEKIQQLKVDRDPVGPTRSGVTLAFEQVDEVHEHEEVHHEHEENNHDAQHNTNNSGGGYSIGVINDDDNENNNENTGPTYKLGIQTTEGEEEQQDDYFHGDEPTGSSQRKESDGSELLGPSNRVSTGIMKATPSNMSVQYVQKCVSD